MADIRRAYCPRCKAETVGELSTVSHLLHLFLAIITAGLWLPVWILSAFSRVSRCRQCGARCYGSRLSAAIHSPAGIIGILIFGAVAAVAVFR
jgi:hypothetical protein